MRQIFIFISIAVLGAGLYFMFMYDVPDQQTPINFFTSRFLIIVGVSSILINLLWDTKKGKK